MLEELALSKYRSLYPFSVGGPYLTHENVDRAGSAFAAG